MSQLLDLSIMLTPPPAGPPPEAIASIALRCDPQGLAHTGDLLSDPLTQQERASLRWYLEEYSDWPYEQFLERAKKIEALLPELGERLYKTVFGSFGAMGTPNPAPCHYMSHGPLPHPLVHHTVTWWRGGHPICSGTGW